MHNFPVHKSSIQNAIRKGMQNLFSGVLVFRSLRGNSITKTPTTNQPKTNLLYCSIDKTLKDERKVLIHCSYSKTSWSNGRIGEAVGELGRSPMTNPRPWGEEHMGWRAAGALAAGQGGRSHPLAVELLCSLVCEGDQSFVPLSPT